MSSTRRSEGGSGDTEKFTLIEGLDPYRRSLIYILKDYSTGYLHSVDKEVVSLSMNKITCYFFLTDTLFYIRSPGKVLIRSKAKSLVDTTS